MVSALVPPLSIRPLLFFLQRLIDFLFLLFNQKLFHRIVVIMTLHQ